MKKRREKSFHIRLNMDKKIDRDIYEWLKAKEERQTISINAFVIEGLRKLKLQEMRADAGAVVMTETAESMKEAPSPIKEEADGITGMENEAVFKDKTQDATVPTLSDEAMDFLDGF